MGTEHRIARTEQVVQQRQQGIIVLEDISDPHNAQAVFRTCDAFGFQHVALIYQTQAPMDPALVGYRSSASAHKWLDYETYYETSDCVTSLKDRGFTLIATALSPKAVSLFELDAPQKKIALMFGNEHTGLSPTAIAAADHIVQIPMRGFVQSFNLSVSAALVMQEITRRRVQRGMEAYLYSEEWQDAYLQDFLYR